MKGFRSYSRPPLLDFSWRNGLPVLAGFVAGLFCLTMTFGNRIWLHHFAVLVPTLYLACASVAEALARLAASWAWGRAVAVAVPLSFGLWLGANAADANEVFSVLNRTKGVGLYSDAIDRFAIDSLGVKDPTFYFFPDWGVFMSFVMLTHGTLPYSFDFDVNRARSLLCANPMWLLPWSWTRIPNVCKPGPRPWVGPSLFCSHIASPMRSIS